ncbi:hypothetical protein K1719_004646 [Acacia pycnantha]|nr:hypothetical protein K1719_004646 [Acacia pycnantha]
MFEQCKMVDDSHHPITSSQSCGGVPARVRGSRESEEASTWLLHQQLYRLLFCQQEFNLSLILVFTRSSRSSQIGILIGISTSRNLEIPSESKQ